MTPKDLIGCVPLSNAAFAKFVSLIPERSRPYAQAIRDVGRDTGVHAFLIWAMIERESRSGEALTPPGARGKGDFDGLIWHGYGLMQVDDRSFPDWLAGETALDENDRMEMAWKVPHANIAKGVSILLGKIKYFTLAAGTGVVLDAKRATRRGVKPATYPDPRPIMDRNIGVRAGIAAYNTGERNVLRSLACGADIDITSADGPDADKIGDYSFDVLRRVYQIDASMEGAA